MTTRAADSIEAWRLLLALSEGQGFKGAAVALDMDLPACTRLMQKLESELGVGLVDHGVRPARLTAEAGKLLPIAKRLVAARDELSLSVQALLSAPLTVRLSLPVNIPRGSVARHIRAYQAKDPGLTVEILSDCDHGDILSGRIDLAYLPYRPPPEGLLVWDVGVARNALLASPEYLKKHDTPATPTDLARHAVILRSGRFYPETRMLESEEGTAPLLWKSIAFRGDVMSGKSALLRGEGIAIDLSIPVCKDEIERGDVVAVLPGWHRPDWDMTIAASREALGNHRLTDFARWLAEKEGGSVAKRRAAIEGLLKGHYWNEQG